MRRALALMRERAPELEVDGEMHADAALVEAIRDRAVPDSRLTGTANLLVMPTLDAANIAFTLLKAAADGLPVGPMLLGMSKPIHVLVPSVTARGIVNLSALAVLEAQVAAPLLAQRAGWSDGMLWLVLGGLTLFLFLGGLRAFERASVTTIKSLLAWIAALGGISLALLLILTGRGGIALGALAMFGPLIWQRWRAYRASIGTAAAAAIGRFQPAAAPAADRHDTGGGLPGPRAASGRHRGGDPRGPSPPDARGPPGQRRVRLAGGARSTRRATCCLGEPAQAARECVTTARQRDTARLDVAMSAAAVNATFPPAGNVCCRRISEIRGSLIVIKPLRKAVLPVAGLGTRFLPATKATAKEMLPVVDKPLIQYAIEEARAAGIEQFCMVTGRGKTALVEHFDIAFELEATLRERGKTDALDVLRDDAGASPARWSPCASRCRLGSAMRSGARARSSATIRSPSCCRTTWCWPTRRACGSSPTRIATPAATSSR